MTGVEIVSSIIQTMTAGITGIGTAIGEGLSSLASSIFLTGTGESQTISVFGTLIVVFAGISLALGLCRLVYQWLTSLGARNR